MINILSCLIGALLGVILGNIICDLLERIDEKMACGKGKKKK